MSDTEFQTSVRAMQMRGGTSKGTFFLRGDLPTEPKSRDALLLRVVGSPDPYRQHIDGMGGATSSTSKVVVIDRSHRTDCDVDYWFGQVSIDQALVDWSGNCGNLSSAVGPFAIHRGLVKPLQDGLTTVRIWQANIQKRIVAHVPVKDGQVVEMGDFWLDGVAFPAAEIALEFLDPGAGDDGEASGPMFPTGKAMDVLHVPGFGALNVTMVVAGNPAVFVAAHALGLKGTELQGDLNQDASLMARLELVRSHAAVRMGLGKSPEQVSRERQHTPKLAFFAPPATYQASDGKLVDKTQVDILARILSMGRLHHAMTGTGAVGIAAAAAVPGTVLSELLGGPRETLVFGHPSGRLRVGASVRTEGGLTVVTQVMLSRSARRLMDGVVFVPGGSSG